MIKHISTRVLVYVLAVALLISALPITALAAAQQTAVQSEQAAAEATAKTAETKLEMKRQELDQSPDTQNASVVTNTDKTVDADKTADANNQPTSDNKQDANAADETNQDKQNTKTDYVYEDSDVKVTATLSDADAIDDDATLNVTKVTKDTQGYDYEAYLKALKKHDDNATAKTALFYDVAFMKDGKEVEPSDGTVKVAFAFKADQLKEIGATNGDDLQVIHEPLKDSAKADTTKDATDLKTSDVKPQTLASDKVNANVDNKTVDFTTSDFSVFAIANVNTKIPAELNNFSVTGAFGDYDDYGIIADDYYQSGDTETNVMVQNYYSSAAEIGASTNYSNAGGDNYIGKVLSGSNSTLRFYQAPAHLYLGDEATSQYENNEISLENVQGTKIIKNSTINPQNIITSISQKFAANEDKGPVFQENDTVDLTSLPSGTYAVTFNGTHFQDNQGLNIKINKGQYLIINMPAENITLSRYNLNGQQSTSYVTEHGSETDWLTTAVVFNMPNATSLNFTDGTVGTYIAPKATVSKNSTIGGKLVCKSYGTLQSPCNGEFHYHNHNLSGASGLKVHKTVDDETPTASQKFTFHLYEKKSESDDKWDEIQDKENNGRDVDFSYITYDQSQIGQTYYYKITEDPEKGYQRNDTAYYAKVEVKKKDNIISPVVTYYSDSNFTKEVTGTPTFKNKTEEKQEKEGSLELKKTVTGTTSRDKVFTFNVTLDKTITGTYGDMTFTNGVAIVNLKAGQSKTATDLPVGTDYTITETDLPDGYTDTSGVQTGTIEKNQTKQVTARNTYSAKGDVTLHANKTYNKALTAGQFNFVVKEGGNVVATGKNDGSGEITFSPIKYTSAGTYHYTISEVIPQDKDANISYDMHEAKVDVDVTDNGDGTLTATPTYKNGAASFSNTYNKVGQAIITAVKSLKSQNNIKQLQDDQFSFELTAKDNAPLNGKDKLEATNNGSSITFPAISYSMENAGKTYEYEIREVAGDANKGYTYDNAVKTVKVTVSDAKDKDKLTTTVTGDGNAATFTNKYQATGSLKLTGQKLLDTTLSGRPFDFELLENGQVIQRKTSTPGGAIAFDQINYQLKDVGTHTYTIREEVPEGVNKDHPRKDGITYDLSEKTVTVNVSDAGNGTLNVSANGNTVSTCNFGSFKNTYSTNDASVQLRASKTLTGQALAPTDKSYTFELVDTDDNNKVIQTKNNLGGTVAFRPITYKKAGTYQYQIREVAGNKAGITYDSHAENVTVTVKDNKQGELVATPHYDNQDGATFTNTYSAHGTGRIAVTKNLTGRRIADDLFTYQLLDKNGIVVATTKNKGNNVVFDNLSYDAPGTYNYTVREVNDSKPGYTYDANDIAVTMDVKDNGDGTLTATPTYTKNGEVTTTPTFNNTYKASGSVQFTAQKVLNGRALKDKEFSFTLSRKDGDKWTQVGSIAKNDKDGNVTFDKITYDQSDIGKTYTYRIAEVKGDKNGIAYDKTAHDIQVAIADNGDGTLKITYNSNLKYTAPTFTNTYTKSGSAQLFADKTLNGGSIQAGQFSFQLKENGKLLQTKSNDATGHVVFDPITYTEDGTHYYTINEVIPDGANEANNYTVNGVSYDNSVKTVTVVATDDGNGGMNITYNGEKAYAGAHFTNTYSATGTAQLSAKKELTGTDNAAALAKTFTFDLKDAAGRVIDTKTAKNGETANFDAISYTAADAGEHDYTISERLPEGVDAQNPVKDGITYDTHVKTVSVHVADNGNGTLTVTYDGQSSFTPETFTNTYDATGEFTPRAAKTLVNRKLREGEFTFALKDGDGNVLDTKTNDADGQVTFDTIHYTKADIGEHTYTITENASGDAHITNDGQPTRTIVVNVADNGNGKLVANPVSDKTDSTTFVNTYNATGDLILAGSKTLTGRALKAGEFNFTLSGPNGVNQTVSNKADGSFAFDAIHYTQADANKTYTYTVTENDNHVAGVTYDVKPTRTIKVHVTDDGNGKMIAAILKDQNDKSDNLNFKNDYTASGSITLDAHKNLTQNGKQIALGDRKFDFTLSGEGIDTQTVQNDNEGNVAFAPITYNQNDVGEHTYTITESSTVAGVTNDQKASRTVTVNVTDNHDGTLKAEVVDGKSDSTTFTNTYDTTDTSAQFTAKKELTGKTLKADEFSFELKDENGDVLQTVNNKADGSVTFAPITYDKAGTYTYSISEKPGKQHGITYDGSVYQVTVVVTDNGKGALSAVTTYSQGSKNVDADEVVFNNTYQADSVSAVVKGTKQLTGKDLAAGAYTFELKDEAGKVVATANNDADGKFSLNTPAFKEVGTYKFTVDEAKGNAPGVTYDDHSFDVTVTVTKDDDSGKLSATVNKTADELTFKNSYRAADTHIRFNGHKVLSQGDLKAGQFRFGLYNAAGQQIDEAKNDENGNFYFANIKYEDVGQHDYTVREINTGDANVAYDNTAYHVTVNVVDNNGQLEARVNNKTVSADYTVGTFTNTQRTDLKVVKRWAGELSDKNRYTPKSIVVRLVDQNGNRVAGTQDMTLTADNAIDGGANTWVGTFNNLSVKDLANYSVEEVSIDHHGVQQKVDSDPITDGHNGTITLDSGTYTVSETADGNVRTLINAYDPDVKVAIHATKHLNGGTLTGGDYTFELRDSDGKVIATTQNTASGDIIFPDVPYKDGYTIREVAGSDKHVSYDNSTKPVKLSKQDGRVTQNDITFTNTYHPVVLSVQKRSRSLSHEPLEGATYGLYRVVPGGNDILVETQVSDANGMLYFTNVEDGATYYFKEIAAPAGHTVEAYKCANFTVHINGDAVTVTTANADGSENTKTYSAQAIATVSEDGLIDLSKAADRYTYSATDKANGVTVVANADEGAFDEAVTLKVSQLKSDSNAYQTAMKQLKAAGSTASDAYGLYDIHFENAAAKEVEPKAGKKVDIVMQYDNKLKVDGNDDLSIVHITDGGKVTSVPGNLVGSKSQIAQAAFSTNSFSTFGIVNGTRSFAIEGGYGVADRVTEVDVSKLDEDNGDYVAGATLQVVEKNTGKVIDTWTTGNGTVNKLAKVLDCNTHYILKEIAAPAGYHKAADTEFYVDNYGYLHIVSGGDAEGSDKRVNNVADAVSLNLYDQSIAAHKVKTRHHVRYRHQTRVITENGVIAKTGDTSPIVPLIAVIALAGAVLVVTLRRQKQHK